jgi:hypothetical protein
MRDVRVYAELRTFVKAWRKFACVLEAGERACVHLSLSLFPSLSLSVPTYACACDRMRPRCSERCCAQQRWQLLLSLSLSLSCSLSPWLLRKLTNAFIGGRRKPQLSSSFFTFSLSLGSSTSFPDGEDAWLIRPDFYLVILLRGECFFAPAVLGEGRRGCASQLKLASWVMRGVGADIGWCTNGDLRGTKA